MSRGSKGVSSIVWAVIGIVIAVIVGVMLYTMVSKGIAGSAGVTCSGAHVGAKILYITIQGTGTGSTSIIRVELYDSAGNLRGCQGSGCPELASPTCNTWDRDVTGSISAGDIRTARVEGDGCYLVKQIVVITTSGVFKGYTD